MKVRAVWQFFEAERDGNSIHLFAPGGDAPLHTFHFGRQRRDRRPVPERLHPGRATTAGAITWRCSW